MNERPLFRKMVATVMLMVSLLFVFPASRLYAAPGGMLSVKAESGAVQNALVVNPDSTASQKRIERDGSTRQSPGTVALISTVLPGYGQVYNGSAWKLPIYYGLLAWFGSNALHDSDQYSKYRDLYRENPTAADAAETASQRDSYRKKRNTQIALFCVTYVLGIVDAYVDAHLYNFDKVMDEGVGTAAAPDGSTTLISVSRKF